jgi:peptide/nickel transport system substrate-binding protein
MQDGTRWAAPTRKPVGLVFVGMCLSLALAACGGSDDKSSDSTKKSADKAAGGSSGGGVGKKGGKITVLGSSFPDYLDPGLSYTVDGWQALTQVYPGLLTFPHKPGQAGAEVAPGLAEDLPKVSNGNKTFLFTLRDGLTYSDASPIKASDYANVVKRALEQDSQGAGFYLPIDGAEKFLKDKKGEISGIKTDDAARTIEITLTKPRGAFLYELAVPFGGMVPGDTAAKNLTSSPPPGAGRYMIKDVKVNRGYTLVKNPNFSKSLEGTAVDSGNLDEIVHQVDRSLANEATKITQNQADFMIDIPPADRIPEIKQRAANRYHEFPTNSTFYFFMNSEVPPFDDLKVRQAVNYAIDIKAINRIQANVLTPANTTLPPGVAGYEKTPDLYPFDLEKAKALIKEAGAEGAAVTVWGNPEDPTKPTIEYYTDVLNSIGLKAKSKIISAETYFATIGNRKTKAQTGWANWFQDYPHPSNFIDVLVNPNKVVESGNNNYSYNAADKELGAKIDKLNAEPELTDDVKKQWAAVDKEIQQKAYWGIYGNRKQTTFMSERMDFENCKGESVLVNHDWSQFCLK